VEYLLRTERAGPVEAIIRAPDIDIHTPALCDVEVTAALRRALLLRALSERRAADALNDYLDLPLTRHGHQALLRRVIDLRSNLSAYDATYVALAERLGGSVLTMDDSLARAVRRHLALDVLPG
jgi:predicted nucleic acid-binding protein